MSYMFVINLNCSIIWDRPPKPSDHKLLGTSKSNAKKFLPLVEWGHYTMSLCHFYSRLSSMCPVVVGGDLRPSTTTWPNSCFSINFQMLKRLMHEDDSVNVADNDLPTESRAAFPRCPAEQRSETLMFATLFALFVNMYVVERRRVVAL